MSFTLANARHVLIAVDGGEGSEYNFNFLIHNLAFEPNIDKLVICSVISCSGSGSASRAQVEKLIEKFTVNAKEDRGYKDVEAVITEGSDPGKAIKEIVERMDITLVLVGSRGYGNIKGSLVGSVSQFLVSNCPCPVIIVRHKEVSKSAVTAPLHLSENMDRRILLALDGSEYSEHNSKFMMDNLAFNPNCDTLVIFSIVNEKEDEYYGIKKQRFEHNMEKFVHQAKERGYKKIENVVEISNDPPKAIKRAVKKLDITLVVVGSRGYGGLKAHLLGSVSSTLVAKCPCPVIVVRPRDINAKEKLLKQRHDNVARTGIIMTSP